VQLAQGPAEELMRRRVETHDFCGAVQLLLSDREGVQFFWHCVASGE
jgi:hypothetical protein